MTSRNCGKCLHDKLAHEKHNGHFMYCGICFSLCELQEFMTEHKPSSQEILFAIQSAREYNEYKPKEITQK